MTSPILQYDEIGNRVVPLGATLRDAGTERLQRSLNALADLKNNAALRVTVDGIMGPKTAGAVNLAIKTYAPESKLPLPLSVTQVRTEQTQLANIIDAYVAKNRLSPKPVTTPVTSKDAIKRLQTAIKSLWPLANDRSLDIVVDGVVGPKTQAAVNTAFQKHITGHKLPLPMSVKTIQDSANTLAQSVENRVKQMKVPGQAAITAQANTDAAKAKNPTQAAAIDKASIVALQKAVSDLGKAVKNPALNIAVDGILGPKTTAATNLALSKYVRGVTAALKSGKLSQSEILSGAVGITKLIQNELIALAKEPPKQQPIAATQAKAVQAQSTVNAAKAAAPSKAAAVDKAVIKALQTAINAIAMIVNQPSITLTVDGIVGPKTQAALNRVLIQYVPATPAQMRSGLTIAQINNAAAAITTLINDEITKLQAAKNKAISAAESAKGKLDESTVADIEKTVDSAFEGNPQAQQGLLNLEAATHSPDPEVASIAQDAFDVAAGHIAERVEVGPAQDIEMLDTPAEWSYLDERTIRMDPDLIEDPAELGMMLGLQEYGYDTIDPADVGAMVGLYGEMGFSLRKAFKGVKKGISKGVKGAAKGVARGTKYAGQSFATTAKYGAKGVSRGVTEAAKATAKAAETLININKIIFGKIAFPLARAMCSVPKPIVIVAAQQAGIDYQKALLFCNAVRAKNMGQIRALLPDALKISVKMAATNAVPGLGPILHTIQLIPSPIRAMIPGLSVLGGWQDDIIAGDCGCY